MLKKITSTFVYSFLILALVLSVEAQTKTSKTKKAVSKTPAKTMEKTEISPVTEPSKTSTKKNERPEAQNQETTEGIHLEAIKENNEISKTNSRSATEKTSPIYFYDLDVARENARDLRVAIVRLEQFYPFPADGLKKVFAEYKNATQLFWTQEEPQNMGGWAFVEPRLREIKGDLSLRYVGRTASASPATGSYAIHNLEQEKLVNDSLIKETDEISASSTAEVAEKLAPAGA
jgi:2-oxoglutarate dehydrogenase E1 component